MDTGHCLFLVSSLISFYNCICFYYLKKGYKIRLKQNITNHQVVHIPSVDFVVVVQHLLPRKKLIRKILVVV